MAKSIRSKWKRKCRAIKRERYAVKELARLKKTLGIKDDESKPAESEVMEADQNEEQVIFLDAGEVTKKAKSKKKKVEAAAEEEEDEAMSSDDEKVQVADEDGKKRVFSSKTLKDENGQYPVWLHKRKIAKMNNTIKKKIKKRSKKRRR
ncbi:protein LLP homolog [Plutella xylostella]|uniref:protein LLP homolog n=1 Tax=Plutella xylostella TaxID=51655 RepID=UPI0005D0DA6B|nr:protein LLP homolog [Plutella xylostella]